MDDVRIGNAIRVIRIRRHLRQADVARRARVSRQVVGHIEDGSAGRYQIDAVRAVAAALGIRLDIRARWHGADLDRVINAAHADLASSVAMFIGSLGGWTWLPEVSFSVKRERGVIDILAWHAATRSLLIVELKTELADPQDLVATMHRRVRLGHAIAEQQGWEARTISAWVIVRRSRTEQRRLGRYRTLLRRAFPQDGREVRRWLRAPQGSVAALSMWTDVMPGGLRRSTSSAKRVRRDSRASS